MKIRLVTRVITFDPKTQKILLVKNRDQDYWYPPGGGWDYDKENIVECAEREVYEETGLRVKIRRLLYVQEFHDMKDSISFETVWLAKPINQTRLDELHVDHDIDGKVEKARWFSKDEMKEVKVFPKRLQTTFWENLENFLQGEDPFIGIN